MSAPPGFHVVPTTADGNCLFHSIFYAWFPEEGVDVANRTESAVLIRKIIADNALPTIKHREFSSMELKEALRIESTDSEEDTVIIEIIDSIQAQLENKRRESSITNASEERKKELKSEIEGLYENLTQIYQAQVLKSPKYWGGMLELEIANNYAMANSLPQIHVWSQPEPGRPGRPAIPAHWYSGREPVGEPCRDWVPIANSKNIHFEICVRDDAPSAIAANVSSTSNNTSESESESETKNKSAQSTRNAEGREKYAATNFADWLAEEESSPESPPESPSTEIPSFLETIITTIDSGVTLHFFEELGYSIKDLIDLGVPKESIDKLLAATSEESEKKKKPTLPDGMNQATYDFYREQGIDPWKVDGGNPKKRVTKKRKISKKKHTRKY